MRVCLASLLNYRPPSVIILWLLLFPKLGIYQKAFEHLGNALTYDPTNYKVLQAVKPQSLHTDGPTTLRGDLALESVLYI